MKFRIVAMLHDHKVWFAVEQKWYEDLPWNWKSSWWHWPSTRDNNIRRIVVFSTEQKAEDFIDDAIEIHAKRANLPPPREYP